MYADAESTFIKYVNKNRSMLSRTAFIPMLTWKVSASMQRELILWADSYIVLPYDIPFLKETIHKVIYGKREARQIYMEDWKAGRFYCLYHYGAGGFCQEVLAGHGAESGS